MLIRRSSVGHRAAAFGQPEANLVVVLHWQRRLPRLRGFAVVVAERDAVLVPSDSALQPVVDIVPAALTPAAAVLGLPSIPAAAHAQVVDVAQQ